MLTLLTSDDHQPPASRRRRPPPHRPSRRHHAGGAVALGRLRARLLGDATSELPEVLVRTDRQPCGHLDAGGGAAVAGPAARWLATAARDGDGVPVRPIDGHRPPGRRAGRSARQASRAHRSQRRGDAPGDDPLHPRVHRRRRDLARLRARPRRRRRERLRDAAPAVVRGRARAAQGPGQRHRAELGVLQSVARHRPRHRRRHHCPVRRVAQLRDQRGELRVR